MMTTVRKQHIVLCANILAICKPMTFVITMMLGTATLMWAQNLPGSKEEVARFVRQKSKTIVLENVRVIDGTGASPSEKQAIVITDGRIAAIGAGDRIIVPKDAVRMNLEGRTALPGLVMLHEHMFYFSGRRTWHSQAVGIKRIT